MNIRWTMYGQVWRCDFKTRMLGLSCIIFLILFLTISFFEDTPVSVQHQEGQWFGHKNLQKRSVKPQPLSPLDHDFLAPNIVLQQTAIGVKTYNRPDCLREFIASVRLYAPYLMIFVIDDSDEDSRSIFLQGQDQGDVYVMLPTDSGTGYGRNRIVEAVHRAGYKYLIMADDDFKLASAETIPMMAKYLTETGADVVAGTRCDHTISNCRRNKGMIVVDEDRNVTIVPNVTLYAEYADLPTCVRSDLVQQFFIARIDQLLKVHWDDRLKNNDHYDFLFSAKMSSLKLVTCTDLNILHEKTCEEKSPHGETYHKVREGRWYKLLQYIFAKWDLHIIRDEVGKTLWVNESLSQGMASWASVYRYPLKSEENRFLIGSVVDVMNAWSAGWLWVRPNFQTRGTWVIREEYGPCVQRLSGLLDYEYDRYRTYKNKAMSTSFTQYIFNETCSFAEKFWQVKYTGSVNIGSRVYYVTAVSDDNSYLMRLINVLDSDQTRERITLIIVLMDKTSASSLEKNKKVVGIEVVIVDAGPPFSRSIGLRIGFQRAMELSLSRGEVDAIGFSIDTSILVPSNFSMRIREATICGVSAFVPIVYKCMSCVTSGNLHNLTDGYWVNSGFGMTGLCLTDYQRLGGWGTSWGYKWGGEDVELLERIMEGMQHIVRAQEPGYVYVRDPALKALNPGYYTNKNLFPRELPPLSLTKFISDDQLETKLLKFIQGQVPEWNDLDLSLHSLTRTYRQDAKMIYYQAVVQNRAQTQDRRVFIVQSLLSPVL